MMNDCDIDELFAQTLTRILPQLIHELERPRISYRVVEAAHTILSFDRDQEEWSGQDYRAVATRAVFRYAARLLTRTKLRRASRAQPA
jgi:hypothetical protein